jgi:hypothetical protein
MSLNLFPSMLLSITKWLLLISFVVVQFNSTALNACTVAEKLSKVIGNTETVASILNKSLLVALSPLFALKYNWLFKMNIYTGRELGAPGFTSATFVVPASVPLESHGSLPLPSVQFAFFSTLLMQ